MFLSADAPRPEIEDLTSHSPLARMLRGVSIIGLPQFAQVGD